MEIKAELLKELEDYKFLAKCTAAYIDVVAMVHKKGIYE